MHAIIRSSHANRGSTAVRTHPSAELPSYVSPMHIPVLVAFLGVSSIRFHVHIHFILYAPLVDLIVPPPPSGVRLPLPPGFRPGALPLPPLPPGMPLPPGPLPLMQPGPAGAGTAAPVWQGHSVIAKPANITQRPRHSAIFESTNQVHFVTIDELYLLIQYSNTSTVPRKNLLFTIKNRKCQLKITLLQFNLLNNILNILLNKFSVII